MYGFFFPTFIALSVVLVVLLIIVGVIAKKLYPLMYSIAVFSYINTITYWIDAYELRANAIVIILLISAFLMIFFGWFIAKKSDFKNKKIMNAKRKLYLWGMIIPAAILLFFAIISMFNIGLTISKVPITDINAKSLFYDCKNEKFLSPGYQDTLVPVIDINIKNDFLIPRKVSFDTYKICADPSNYYLNFDVSDDEQSYNTPTGVEINPFSSKALKFSISQTCLVENQTISKIYVLDVKDNTNSYFDCSRMTKKQKADAIIINVIN
jgi:hypothetical protein